MSKKNTTTAPTPDSDELRVRAFLENHPEYLSDNPELLIHLEVPHATAGATSLIERQVTVLREKNSQLQGQISNMVDNANSNEQQLRQIQIVAEKLATTAAEHSPAATEALLGKAFAADWCRVIVDSAELSATDTAALTVCRALCKKGPKSGITLPSATLDALQPETGKGGWNLAIIPLGESGKQGVALLASGDQQRFQTDHDTLFLELLSTVLTLALTRPQE